jgi:hypothetical protein
MKKEQIEELSKTTLTGYVHSAMSDRGRRDDKISKSLEKQRDSFSKTRHKNVSKMMDKNEKRSSGIQSALNKLTTEMSVVGTGGFTGSAAAAGPVAGFDPILGKTQRRKKLKSFKNYAGK